LIEKIIAELAQQQSCEVTDIKSDLDHIHFLLRYPPTVALSSIIGALKSKSASAVLDTFGPVYYGKHEHTFWSSGFFLCSVGGATIEILKQYIENQDR
jgi:putative transposase